MAQTVAETDAMLLKHKRVTGKKELPRKLAAAAAGECSLICCEEFRVNR